MKDALTNPTSEFTSESVGEGHPDKVCDFIADSLLDAHLAQDPQARTAIEVLCKGDTVILAGEITSRAQVDPVAVTREAIRQVGYSESGELFSADSVHVMSLLSEQAQEIARAVGGANTSPVELGAGDQGIMYGYATDETPELMPLPILLAHRITRALSEDRKACRVDWLRPDAKAQVTVCYSGDRPHRVRTVLVSTQHREGVPHPEIRRYVEEDLLPRALGSWHDLGMTVLVNPSGSFAEGGPEADCGLTGRKIIADTYGGFARHGGGAFSGKDATKVDRSGAYFCRHVARQLVRSGICRRAEVRVAYAIGMAQCVSLDVETFGTGDTGEARAFLAGFDFRPGAIIEQLGLRRPIYRQTTNFGHFGRIGFSWEDDVTGIWMPTDGR